MRIIQNTPYIVINNATGEWVEGAFVESVALDAAFKLNAQEIRNDRPAIYYVAFKTSEEIVTWNKTAKN